MKRKESEAFPRSVTLKPPDMQPDLPTSFRRWVDAGELPRSAVLCVFVGSADHKRKECYQNVENGELIDASELETLSYVNVHKENPRKSYMIFVLPVAPSAGR